MDEFAAVSMKIERRPRGEGVPAHYRIVFEETRGKERTVTKTEWAPRHVLYAHVARANSKVRKFVFEGMGKVPVG